jgi:hypothetical protein
MLIFEHAVCQREDACIGFPLAGGISTEENDITNMTCYKEFWKALGVLPL